jgi:hypothetical protein
MSLLMYPRWSLSSGVRVTRWECPSCSLIFMIAQTREKEEEASITVPCRLSIRLSPSSLALHLHGSSERLTPMSSKEALQAELSLSTASIVKS